MSSRISIRDTSRTRAWRLAILFVVVAAFWSSCAPARAASDSVDLALGRPVVASSVQNSSYPASAAVDGDPSTRWSSDFSDPQWIYVDLGATYNIDEVRLKWERAYAQAYGLQVSDDAVNWTTIYSTTAGSPGVDDLTGLSGTGRYVRVHGTVRGTQWGYSLWDFSVYGTPVASVSGTPVASSGTPPTSSSPTGRILWGAYMEGTRTYAYYYGNPAPNGANWEDAPWGGTANTWDQFEIDAGKKVSIDEYGQPPPWLQSFSAGTAGLVIRRGAIPAIGIDTSVGPNGTTVTDQQIADGLYDSQITAWFAAAASWGHPFFLVMDAEMNGGWEPYAPGRNGNTAASFVAMWRHMHDLAVAAGASNVTWVWCPNVDPGDLFTPYSQLYPGDAYVDWTGMDGFNQGGDESFQWVVGSSYDNLLALAPTKPIFISQTASVEGGIGKAAWITDMLSTQLPQRFPQIKALIWFNWRIFENGTWWEWPIESSSSAMSAWRTGIASSYYASNDYGALPLLTKVQPSP